ncbi:cysteine dioxygenase family protein [Metabacillus litoralis]|uniref:cysteine dioxygenase n=1 Tax=Metabacillus TaxID=2675233 RepID=UPI000EF620EB|nr:cysteine dioxygenase family protein [Metabacillus litoralis]MCM3164015.1 cysteine dioxygenase family protein [Metabacillus litoralis]MCM3410505.1 cysteine dioxygenase family protein [Metabacillus litoralis]UHA58401.1 cysteine dioxygenase family protein [Metabacillus litoralis]
MDYKDRISEILGNLENTSSDALKQALEELAIQHEELEPILGTEEDKPYYRKLLYKNEKVELLVMNWSQLECAPHDHGSSFGWIQVINGTAKNTVYKVDGTKMPKEIFTEFQENGEIFFAPEKGVHKMSVSNKSKLVTLHLYSPPITGMKVYDLNTCAACVVSDDCGAWWPEEQRQKIKEIQLDKN